MGNSCCCRRQEGSKRMAAMTDEQKKVILDNDSNCIGVLLTCYRILIVLFLVASLIPNFAIQRDPVAGPDPAIYRFDAMPHVIWMIAPFVMLAYAERARLLGMFADRTEAKYLTRRIGWVTILVIVDIVASAVHFLGFLLEVIDGSSPLYSSTNTLVWLGVFGTLFQFLWGIWILSKFMVFKDNLRVALDQGLPFSGVASSIEDPLALAHVGIGHVSSPDKRKKV